MILRLTNSYTFVEGATPQELLAIYRDLAVRDPVAWFKPKYPGSGWIHFFDRKTKSFSTGLLQIATLKFAKLGIKYSINDVRRRPEVELKPLCLNGVNVYDYPYDYQSKCIELCVEHARGVVEAATNAGKTEIIAGTAQMLDVPSLVLTNTLILLDQTIQRLHKRLGVPIGKIGEGVWRPEKITVGMIQTLGNRLAIEDDECLRYLNTIDAVFADECQHLQSLTWYEICMATDAYYRFGYSGTALQHSDPEDYRLIGVTGPLLFEIPNRELIRRGISAKPTVWLVDNRDPHASSAWTYKDAYKYGIAESEWRALQVCRATSHFLVQNKQVFILIVRIDQGRMIQRMLTEIGVESVFLWGDIGITARRDALERYQAGTLRCAIASTIADEGMDLPAIDSLILAGGQQGWARLKQRLGRGLRRKEGGNVCDIVDFLDFGHEDLLLHSRERLKLYENEGFEIQRLNLDDATGTQATGT